jgi:hypothetical protein
MTDVLGAVFKGVDTAKGVAQLFGLLESIDVKIDKLLQVELKAGLSTLKAATNSESVAEQKILLWDARNFFQKAVYLEDDSKKAIAMLGLFCCYRWLGDEKNSVEALDTILEIQPVTKVRLIKAVGLILYDRKYSMPTKVVVSIVVYFLIAIGAVASCVCCVGY